MIYRDYKHWKLKTSNVCGVICIANEQDRCSKIGYIFPVPRGVKLCFLDFRKTSIYRPTQLECVSFPPQGPQINLIT